MPEFIGKRPRARHPGLPPAILSLAGFGAAFAVASCCALPLLLSAVGIGSAGLASIADMAAPHRDLLLIAAAACLGGAALLLWRQSRTAAACQAADMCSRASVRRTMAGTVALGCVLLVLGYLYA